MATEPDHFVLRRYCDARDRGDTERAAELWEQLCVNNWDRINQIVRAFRFAPGGPRIPEDELGAAASEAYLRAMSMAGSFRAREIGRFYAALFTCVDLACRDFGRRELRHEKRAKGSLDRTYEPDGDAGPFDRALAEYGAEREAQLRDAVEAELELLEAQGLIAWAIGQVENDDYREVLHMTWIEKLPAEEISERLGISLDNVYARRSRGLKELKRILRDSRA